MMCHNNLRFMSGTICLILTLALVSGCIAEDLSKCFKGISLKAHLQNDISGGEEAVKDISLYVFDDKDLLVDILPFSISETVVLNYKDIPTLHCIALGNIRGGEVAVSDLKPGDPLEKGFISLQQVNNRAAILTRAANIYNSPSDLFFGEIKLENNTVANRSEESREFMISRMVASMNITIRGLQRITGRADDNYSVVVHETASMEDFKGRFGGAPAAYQPEGSMNDRREFIVPSFNLLPTVNNSGLTIDIYHDNQLLRTVTTANDNRPIIPVIGKTLNVLVNFEGSADINLVIGKWGDTHIWKDFG